LKDTVTTIALDGDCTYVDRLKAIAGSQLKMDPGESAFTE